MAPTTPQRMDIDKPRTPSRWPTTPVGLTTRRRAKQIELEEEQARHARRAHVAKGSSRSSTSGAPSSRSIEKFGRVLFTPPDSPSRDPRVNFHQPGFPLGVTAAAELQESINLPALNEPREYDGPMFTQDDVDRLSQLPDLPTLDGPYGPGYHSAGRYQTPVTLLSRHPTPAPDYSSLVGGLQSVPVPLPQLGTGFALGLSLRAPTPGPPNGRWSLEPDPNRSIVSQNYRPYSPEPTPPEYSFVRTPSPGLPTRSLGPNPLSEEKLTAINDQLMGGDGIGRSRFRRLPKVHKEQIDVLTVGPVRREKKLSLRGNGKPSTAPISPARPRRSSTAYRDNHK